MIKQYVKITTHAQAIQWDGENLEEVQKLAGSTLARVLKDGALKLHTPHGIEFLKKGSYLVRTNKDLVYGAEPEAFLTTYIEAQGHDWQSRLMIEKRSLDDKIEHLNDFLDSEVCDQKDNEEKYLIMEQYTAMCKYSEMLQSRIDKLGE